MSAPGTEAYGSSYAVTRNPNCILATSWSGPGLTAFDLVTEEDPDPRLLP